MINFNVDLFLYYKKYWIDGVFVKNIHVVGIVGLPACYGGFETLVENLANCNDEHLTVYCSGKNYPKSERITHYKNANLVYIPIKANGFYSVLYDAVSMLSAILKRADTILILGVSGCLLLPIVRLFTKAKIITNIDGLEWRRDKWNKYAKKFLKISEAFAVRYSDEVIADNKAISDYVTAEYGKKAHVIAYGGDHVGATIDKNRDEGYALSLCRIEPENNVEMILSAFSKTTKKLKFVGNWENSDFGRRMKAEYDVYSNIEMLDPIYDIEKLSVIRGGCSYYVHGHSAGGTNPSLVEMMHFSKTILCFDCSYNRASTDNKAFFFSNDEQLTNIITSDLQLENGDVMYQIAQAKYTWEVIGKQYYSLLH